MYSQNTKQFLRKLLYGFCLSIFPFSPQPSLGFHISLWSSRRDLPKGFLGESCNSVRWIHRSQSSFSESFFLILIGGYFFWSYSLQRDPKYQFSDSTETGIGNDSMKYSCNSVSGSHTSKCSFSESFLPVFIWGYFLLHRRPLWTSKYPFANYTRTLLANGSWRGKL